MIEIWKAVVFAIVACGVGMFIGYVVHKFISGEGF